MSTDSDLYFRQLALGDMANLVYLIGSRSTRECLIVDPAWDVDRLLDQAAEDVAGEGHVDGGAAGDAGFRAVATEADIPVGLIGQHALVVLAAGRQLVRSSGPHQHAAGVFIRLQRIE